MTAAKTSRHLVLKQKYRFKMFLDWRFRGLYSSWASWPAPSGPLASHVAMWEGQFCLLAGSRCYVWAKVCWEQHTQGLKGCKCATQAFFLGKQSLGDMVCLGASWALGGSLHCFCTEQGLRGRTCARVRSSSDANSWSPQQQGEISNRKKICIWDIFFILFFIFGYVLLSVLTNVTVK